MRANTAGNIWNRPESGEFRNDSKTANSMQNRPKSYQKAEFLRVPQARIELATPGLGNLFFALWSHCGSTTYHAHKKTVGKIRADTMNTIDHDVAGQCFQDEYYAQLEHEEEGCPQDLEIKIPTYPGSERVMRILVCDKCRHWYDESTTIVFARQVEDIQRRTAWLESSNTPTLAPSGEAIQLLNDLRQIVCSMAPENAYVAVNMVDKIKQLITAPLGDDECPECAGCGTASLTEVDHEL